MKDKGDFSEPGQTVYNFGRNKIVAVKALIHSQNFKTSGQTHVDYDYLFCFQDIYAFLFTPMQTPMKQQVNEDPTLYLPYIKKSKIV